MTDTPDAPQPRPATVHAPTATVRAEMPTPEIRVDTVPVVDAEVQRLPEVKPPDTRRHLAIGFSAATFSVGVAYLAAPIWADPAAWEQASGPFQTVFTAMVGITGTAVGYYFSTSKGKDEDQ